MSDNPNSPKDNRDAPGRLTQEDIRNPEGPTHDAVNSAEGTTGGGMTGVGDLRQDAGKRPPLGGGHKVDEHQRQLSAADALREDSEFHGDPPGSKMGQGPVREPKSASEDSNTGNAGEPNSPNPSPS